MPFSTVTCKLCYEFMIFYVFLLDWKNFGYFPCITEITNGDPLAIGYENSLGLLVQRSGFKDQGESSSTLKATNSESLALKYYVLDSLVPAVVWFLHFIFAFRFFAFVVALNFQKAAMWFDAGLATALTQPYFIRCAPFPLNLVLVHQQSRRSELLLRERLATLSSYSPTELTLSSLQDEPVQQIQGMSTHALNKVTSSSKLFLQYYSTYTIWQLVIRYSIVTWLNSLILHYCIVDSTWASLPRRSEPPSRERLVALPL